MCSYYSCQVAKVSFKSVTDPWRAAECGAHQNTVVTMAWGPAGVGDIMPRHQCGGSHHFLKLQKEATTKALRWLRAWRVSVPLVGI